MAVVLSSLQQQQQKLDFGVKSETVNMINVFLKMWDGKTLCCVIDPHQTATAGVMDSLEQKVTKHYPRTSPNDYFFEVGGKPLSDNAIITNNSPVRMIKDGSTVFVQYRNKGGCFMVSFSIMMVIFTLILGSTCTCGTSLLLVPLLLPFLFVLPLFCL